MVHAAVRVGVGECSEEHLSAAPPQPPGGLRVAHGGFSQQGPRTLSSQPVRFLYPHVAQGWRARPWEGDGQGAPRGHKSKLLPARGMGGRCDLMAFKEKSCNIFCTLNLWLQFVLATQTHPRMPQHTIHTHRNPQHTLRCSQTLHAYPGKHKHNLATQKHRHKHTEAPPPQEIT